MSAKDKKKLDYKQLKISDDYRYLSDEEQEEEQEKQKEEQEEKQDKKQLIQMNILIGWLIRKTHT